MPESEKSKVRGAYNECLVENMHTSKNLFVAHRKGARGPGRASPPPPRQPHFRSAVK